MLRPQSGSEHELTDPLTSLCCLAPALRCMFVWRPNTSFCRCCAAAGLFSFLPRLCRKFCRAVQADVLHVFLCWFPVRFVTRATLSVNFKDHTSANAAVVLLSRSGLESISCSWKSLFTEGERRTREVPGALGAQLWTEHLRDA